MSVQANTYIMRGAIFAYKDVEARATYERLEPYMDDAFKGAHHNDGICVLFDGMNGNYVVAGEVYTKSRNHEGLQQVFTLPDSSLDPDKDRALQGKIEALIGLPAHINWVVLTHYR